MYDIKENWSSIKEKIRVEYDLTKPSFDIWINPLVLKSVSEDKVCISIPSDNSSFLKYITKNYLKCFIVTISELCGRDMDVEFDINSGEKEDSPIPVKKVSESTHNEKSLRSNLITKYTFDNFIQGNNNKFAYSAALAVAENPGKDYNPLYIYGGAGLGKTHLMNAIGNYIIDARPNMNVLYVPSEVFTREVINAIRSGDAKTMNDFRDKYNSIDVFLIDDIQYIIGKDATQLEFFNIFNMLHAAAKQIVISSDKPPKQLEYLEERFQSRFEWGVLADIKAPDYETRMAILKRNTENTYRTVDDEVLSYIATNVKSNIRELEGALNKLMAFMNLNNIRVLKIGDAMEALKDIVYPDKAKSLSMSNIIDKVAEEYDIPSSDILSAKRSQEIVEPRHVAMYLCRTMTDFSYKAIAKKFNRNDHSTVKHAEDKIASEVETNGDIKRKIDSIKEKINPAF